MARSLSLSLSKTYSPTTLHRCSSRLIPQRAQSNLPSSLSELTDDAASSSDPLLRKLEDAIHRILVRRAAPDWLPFIPGSSYWVPPPRSASSGIAHLVQKLANPLTDEESLSMTSVRGWPSSDYFVKGTLPNPDESAELQVASTKVIVETTSRDDSRSEDEET